MAGVCVPVAVALDADGAVGVLAIAVVAGGAQLARRACNSIEPTIVSKEPTIVSSLQCTIEPATVTSLQ